MISPPPIGPNWPGIRALTTDLRAPLLDFETGLAQRQATFRFELVNGVTGQNLGSITPIRQASLSHDTSRTTKRQLTFPLGRVDTAAVNPLTDRVLPFMVLPGIANSDRPDGDWPLGRYMWADESKRETTAGDLGSEQLVDEMFLVDQEIVDGISGVGQNVVIVAFAAIAGLPVTMEAEASPFLSADAWGAGTGRGQILEALATAGDFFSPWFDNTGKLRLIRTFNAANQPVDIDLDIGNRVLRDSVLASSEILTAPNTIIVVSNNSATPDAPCVGVAEVPVNAPNSVANRGFVIAKTFNLQLTDAGQAAAAAQGLVERMAISEQISLSTPPDPRHDSYNVIRWKGANWLELAWSMPLTEGSDMTHTLRKSYSAA